MNQEFQNVKQKELFEPIQPNDISTSALLDKQIKLKLGLILT